MVEPASSSLKRLPLSTAWLLRRSRQPVLHCKQSYLLHHLEREGETPLLLSKKGWSSPRRRSTSRPPPLLPRSTADPPPLLPPRPRRQSEHCSSSGQRVKTTKSTQWKKARSQVARCPKAPKKTSEEPKTSPQAGRQLLTLKKLIDGYSAEATLPARRTKSRGDLRKHPQVKERRRLNRSKNSLKEKHPRMMKEHQKCKKKNYFSLEKDMLLKLQQRKLKKQE